LRQRPELIDDFFGRAWIDALLGVEAAERIRTRLDGGSKRSQRTINGVCKKRPSHKA
jgi:hypothetical protein